MNVGLCGCPTTERNLRSLSPLSCYLSLFHSFWHFFLSCLLQSTLGNCGGEGDVLGGAISTRGLKHCGTGTESEKEREKRGDERGARAGRERVQSRESESRPTIASEEPSGSSRAMEW